ncbi:MAG: signal peptidase II [Actinobacteria bacterium]|nr:signal peptidase II [Actinomycetota bacterium]
MTVRIEPGGRRRLQLAAAAAVIAGADLAAKTWADAALPGHTVRAGLLDLQLAYNSGVAFSVGRSAPRAVVVLVTATITAVVAALAWRTAPTSARQVRLAVAAILGGAVANLIDRAGDGVVTDYLHTGWWPTFNLADVSICLGAALLALHSLSTRTAPTDDSAQTLQPLP